MGIAACLTWLVTALITRISSLSAQSLRRSEARVLAVKAARAKAEAMAEALGQTLGEPLRVEERAAPSWSTPAANMMLNNDSVAQRSETVASGKLRVHAGVSVVFTLRAA